MMVKKSRQYTNPFLKAKEPKLGSIAPAIPSLQDALALHQQGRLDQAELIYRQLLENEPTNADALHLLGVIAHQTGHHIVATEMIGRAIEINPNAPSYYSNRALSLHALKQLDAAVSSYDRAIALKPDFAEAYYNRGNALKELKQMEAAVASYDKAILLKFDYAEAYSNRGHALQEMKQLDTAVTSYDRAITLKPDYAEAYYNRGNALQEMKQLDASLWSYDKAIFLQPEYADAHANRGVTLHKLKQLEAAAASYKKAIELSPRHGEAYYNQGNVLQEMKQLDSAVISYDKAITLKPDNAYAYYNRGVALHKLKLLDAAVASYDKAIELKPNYAEAYSNRGHALQELKQLDAAMANFDRAIALKPDYAEAYYNRAHALQVLKQFDAAVANYNNAFAIDPELNYLRGMRQHAKMFICDWQDFESNVIELDRKIQNNEKASPCFPILALPISMSQQRKAAEIWSADKFSFNPLLGAIPKSSGHPKIRIGYYSADFRLHPVSILSVGLFEHHDKSKFELYAFSFGPDVDDEIRGRIKGAFDKFIDVSAMSDQEVAALSRTLGIDIAIDLGGYTQDCRTGIFSFRAAPLQLSYIGYLGTMGASYYDYLIADQTLIPPEHLPFYSEKIVYLPSYQVNDSKQKIPHTALSREVLNLPLRGFVFCCFNATYKITPTTFDGWMRILKSVPQSVLLLYSSIKTAELNLKQEAHQRGVDPERLIFGGNLTRSDYLARCRSADLFLDTLPYNAGATASDALWAGLPVLTCMGQSFASRYAASLLYAIGLPELVTQTQAHYEALAVELATNPLKLKAIKDKIEINRLTTPLFDTAMFTKHIEAAYAKMYEGYLAGLPPDHIFINA